MTKDNEAKRSRSLAAQSEDAKIKLGNNYAGVLKGYIQQLQKEDDAMAAIRTKKKEIKNKAKKDGFDGRDLDQIVRDLKMEEPIRVAREIALQEMKKALGMATNLFEVADIKEKYSATEKDADKSVAA